MTDIPQRVLMLASPPAARGPIPRLARLLAEGLESHGCHTQIADWGGDGLARGVTAAVKRTRQLGAIRALLRDSRPDFVLVHTAHDLRAGLRDLMAIGSVTHEGLPLGIVFHGSLPAGVTGDGWLCGKLLLHSARLSDVVFVLSQGERCAWRTLDQSLDVWVVRNAFQAPLASPMAHEAAGLHMPLRVLYAGRIVREKGILDLLVGLRTVKETLEVRATVAGDGPDMDTAVRLAKRLNLDSDVAFVGHVPPDVLWRYYSESDMLVLPSWREGFPTVVLEAMAAGLPVIVTPVGAIPDVMRDCHNAVYIEQRTPSAVAAAILRLATDQGLRGSMVRANRELLQQFHPRAVATEYLEAMGDVLKRRRRADR